jgi:hypothetical protein
MLYVLADFISRDFFFDLQIYFAFKIYAIIFSLMQFGTDKMQYFSVLCDLAKMIPGRACLVLEASRK